MPPSGHETPNALIARLVAARSTGDVDRAVDCYEPEATIVAQPGRIVSGRQATRTFVEATIRIPLSFVGRMIVVADGIALHQASWSATQADGTIVIGRTADVLRRQLDGTWLVAIDNPWGSAPV